MTSQVCCGPRSHSVLTKSLHASCGAKRKSDLHAGEPLSKWLVNHPMGKVGDPSACIILCTFRPHRAISEILWQNR